MRHRKYSHLDGLAAALDAQDAPAVLALLTDDCFFQAGNTVPVRGREAIRETLEGFFPAVRSICHRMDDVFEAGDTVVYRGTVTYTRHDGSQLTVPVCDVFKMRQERIGEYYIYIDWSDL